MAKEQLITGHIIPERRPFGHDGLRLYVEMPDTGTDICLLFGVTDNQLIAKIIGDVGQQSNVALKRIVARAEEIVLNAHAFRTGAVFDVDVIGIIRDSEDRTDGSMEFHYMENIHDIITERENTPDMNTIWNLCISNDGLPLTRCLRDLRSALRELDDTPFYCYRAIEIIKTHIGTRFGESIDKQQWEVMRANLCLDRADIEVVKKYADPLRHGGELVWEGSQWREIVRITWDIVQAYIEFLWEIDAGAKNWPTVTESP